METKVEFALLYNGFSVPLKAHQDDAGFDVFATQDHILQPGEPKLIPLGFKMSMENGFEGQIRPRSSMGKKGIIIPNSPGTVDAGYRGEVKVPLLNLTNSPIEIKEGDRVAQLVINKLPDVQVTYVKESQLSETLRGTGGFGSTDMPVE